MNTADLSAFTYAKVQPQAKDIERAVLGAVMMVSGLFDKASELLTPDSFYVDTHKMIFKACQQLKSEYSPIDIMTVTEQLRKNEELEIIGGPYILVQLTNEVTNSANIETHCRIIYQKFLQREVIRLAGEAINNAFEPSTDAFELIEHLSVSINSLQIKTSGKEYTTFLENGELALAQIENIRKSGNSLTGAPSGIICLDQITQGFQPTDLIIIAARPGVGKSAIAANIARGAASHPVKPTNVGVFSLEMSSLQWVMRIMTAESEVDGMDMKHGRVSDSNMERLNEVVYNRAYKDKIFFDDTASLSISQLKNKARRMVLKEKVGLIIVDYLQLTSANIGKGNREQEVSMISRELKQLAKELVVPVIALSQLSRQGDGTKPKLSHLRESGAIEQDADMVMFLMPADETGKSDDPMLIDSILIDIAKFRSGAVEEINARFVRSIQKIFDENDYQRYMNGHPPNVRPLTSLPIPTRSATYYTEPATHDDIEEIESKPF